MFKNDVYINSEDSIGTVIEVLNELAISDKCVFRGINKNEEIYPQLIRDTNYCKYEKKLLYNFDHYGSSFMNANSPIDFMSYAQHFGLPTRLIDFTHNPFIALSFALHRKKQGGKNRSSDESNYYTILYASIKDNIYAQNDPIPDALYPKEVGESDSLAKQTWEMINRVESVFNSNELKQLIDLGIVVEKSEIEEGIQKIKDKRILFVDPNQSNQRLIMQQGLFMFPYTLDKDLHRKILTQNTASVRIHKSLRRPLIEYLDILGMNNYRLMPDLGSVCSEIKRRVITDRLESIDEGVGISKVSKGQKALEDILKKYGSVKIADLVDNDNVK